MTLATAAFLVAHGLIHLAFLQRPPAQTAGGPIWPFDLQASWIADRMGLGAHVRRAIGVTLVVVTTLAWTVAGLTLLGVAPSGLWLASIGVGAVSSLVVLGGWFHRWLTLGIVIDLALWWAIIEAGWRPT